MSDLADLISDNNINMSDSADVNLGGVTMWDLQDVKPDVNVTTAVKPYSLMTTSASQDVKPVVKRENSDSLEDEESCIEALRAAVLLQADNIRQRGSVPSVTAANTDMDKNTGSLETDGYKDEDQPGTASSKAKERSAYPSPSHTLDCTDIKEEKTETCEPKRHPEGPEISERHGEKTPNAIWKEQVGAFKSQDSGSQTPQVDPEHCEPDRMTDVEQARQSDVTPGQFGCLWYPNVYLLLTDRQRHMKQVHSDECLKASVENRWQHVTSSHQQSGPSVAFLESSVTSGLEKSVNKADRVHTGENPDVHGRSFGNGHKTTHTGEKPYKCDVFGKVFDQSSSSSNKLAHMRNHTGLKQYICGVCGKNFTSNCAFVTHKKTHTRERPYKCDACGKDFSLSSNLVSHRRTHTGERPYKCDVCGKAFHQNIHLLNHIRTHTGERPYKCDVCGKDFAVSCNLISHRRTHVGERPYKCDVCGKAFDKNIHLLTHKRIHTDENPYKCDVCGKDYAYRSVFVIHKRTHTGEKPYKCDICGKDFTRSCGVVIHRRLHTGERPYKCDVCGKDFRCSNHLVLHKRTHTGERPYKCDVCGKAFNQNIHLLKHIRTHTTTLDKKVP